MRSRKQLAAAGDSDDDDSEPLHYSDRSKLVVPLEGDTFEWLAVTPYRAALKPWSFPSKGKTSRSFTWKGGRSVTTFSSHESISLRMHERRPEVIEIFDQVPLLPTSDVRWLASRLGLSGYPNKGRYATTDLVLRIRSGSRVWWEAVSVKPAKELRKPRTRLHLEVERLFWHMRQVAWRLDTDETYSPIDITNVMLLAPSSFRDEFMPINPELGRAIVDAVDAALLGPPLMRLCDALAPIDATYGVTRGTAMSALRWALAVGNYPVPHDHRISPTMCLEDLTDGAA